MSSAAAPESNDSREAAQKLIESVSRALDERRYQTALESLGPGDGGDDDVRRLLRGRSLLGLGRLTEAARELGAVSAEASLDPASVRALAWAASWRGDHGTAEVRWNRAIAVDPSDGEAILGRSRTLLASGDAASALRDAEAAAGLPGVDVEASRLVAVIHTRASRLGDAEATLRAAIAAHPNDVGLLEDLAALLSPQHRDAEVLACLERARSLTVDQRVLARIDANSGIAMRYVGREREGGEALLRALSRFPVLRGHLELGPALLSSGALGEGWRQYEHRWFVPPLAGLRANYGVPHWTGQPLAGKTILIRCEQGFGDIFQFVRYLPKVKALGARVVLLPLIGLERMARRFPGVDHIPDPGESLPPLDFHANLLSLPIGFATTLDTIPADIPYLAPDEECMRRWTPRVRRGKKPLVGIIWAGRPSHTLDRLRSLSIEQLAPILAIDGIRFVSLQKGSAVTQAEVIPESVDWDSIGPELDDFEDAGAVLANLDLLICVDTGPAHLAGAMGKDAWVLLPTPADFRWLRDRADSPWYPTLRLFRQSDPGAWAEVIDRVASELRRWLADHEAGKTTTEVVLPTQNDPATQVDIPTSLARAAHVRAGFIQYFPEDRTGRSLEYYGEWLEPVLDAIRVRLPKGATVLEVGAGVGAHTLPIAQAVGDGGLVLAFESDARHRAVLELNLAAQGCMNVTALPAAAGSDPGEGESRESLDSLCLPVLAGILVQDRADAATVLAGAADTLWRCRPWVVALAAREDELEAARAALREFGYDVWLMRVPVYSSRNFNRRDDDRFDGLAFSMLYALPEESGAAGIPQGASRWS